ncbi:hypothetical protein ACFL60_09790, partial [Candidatus Omnitrophota bacterium]
GLAVLYVLIWLVLGTMNYRRASENFYSVDRHFALYLTNNEKISKSIIKGSWCALIAKQTFLSKSEKEKEAFARQFFDEEIARLASEQGYNIQELKEWFMRYAWWNVETMPVKEFMFDWKGEKSILYRDINLSDMPRRQLSYFFFSPDKFKDSFWALIVVGIPFLVIFFAIRRYLYGNWI